MATVTQSAAPVQDGGPSAARRMLRGVGWFLAHTGSIIAMAIAWEWLARSGLVTPFQLPTLSSVLERIWANAVTGDLFINLGVTLYRALTGFLIAAVVGVLLGMAMSRIAI